MSAAPLVVVSRAFDDVRAGDVRFLQHAATLGPVTAFVWPDAVVLGQTGQAPKFPLAERLYLLNALRYVARAVPLTDDGDVDTLPDVRNSRILAWVDTEDAAVAAWQAF